MPKSKTDFSLPSDDRGTEDSKRQYKGMKLHMAKVTLVKPVLGSSVVLNVDETSPVMATETAAAVQAPTETVADTAAQGDGFMNAIGTDEASSAAATDEPAVAKSKPRAPRPKVGRPAREKSAAKKPRKKRSKEIQEAGMEPVVAKESMSQVETLRHEEAGNSTLIEGHAGVLPPSTPAFAEPQEILAAAPPSVEASIAEGKMDKVALADRIQINQLQKELARIELAKDLAEDAKVRQMDMKFTVFVIVLFVAVMLGLAALINNHKTVVITSAPVPPAAQALPESRTTLEPLDKPAEHAAPIALPAASATDSSVIQPAPATLNQPALGQPVTVPAATMAAPGTTAPAAAASSTQGATPSLSNAEQDKVVESEHLLSILNRE